MELRQKALAGSVLLTLGEGVGYVASFLRNMILARTLSKSDFGIAAAFALIVTLLEFSAKLGIARFVVRDKDGSEPDFIAAAHLVQVAVALFSALFMAACAGPLSSLFGISEHSWAVALLSLVPLVRGLEHLDVRKFERDMRFGPSQLVEAVPQVVVTLAAWPVASWFGDYRAVLVLLLVKAVASGAGSHLLAERPYRWRLHWEYIGRMLRFGWPLLVSGFLMFGVMQGDQFLVAAHYTMTDLGPYAAAAALTLAPTFFFGRVFNTVMLPVLATVQDDDVAFRERYRKVLSVVTVFAVAGGLGMVLGAEAFMRLVYGAKYAGAGILLGWLSAANAFRNVRMAPALAAIAKGDSQNQMISNWWRASALVPAAAFAVWHQPLWWIAGSGLLGEAFACWVSFRRLERRDGVPISSSLFAVRWVVLAVALAGALASLGFYRLPPAVGLLLALSAAAGGSAAAVAVLPDLRAELFALRAHLRRVGWRTCLRQLSGEASPAGSPGS